MQELETAMQEGLDNTQATVGQIDSSLTDEAKRVAAAMDSHAEAMNNHVAGLKLGLEEQAEKARAGETGTVRLHISSFHGGQRGRGV